MRIKQIGDFVICRFDDDEILKSEKYWTRDATRVAKPVPFPVETDSGIIPSIPPDELPIANADIGVLPYKCGGKLFFTQLGSYVGSAQFVGSNDVLLSAAHCIFDREKKYWSNNVRFFRGYKSGDYGNSFCVRAMAVHADWINGTGVYPGIDFGFLVTTSQSDVGHLSYSLEFPNTGTAFGYPGNFHGGEIMQTVSGGIEILSSDARVVSMDGNPMGGGCSGGAWTNDYNIVIGLNAAKALKYPIVKSPRLTADFDRLYNFVIANK